MSIFFRMKEKHFENVFCQQITSRVSKSAHYHSFSDKLVFSLMGKEGNSEKEETKTYLLLNLDRSSILKGKQIRSSLPFSLKTGERVIETKTAVCVELQCYKH